MKPTPKIFLLAIIFSVISVGLAKAADKAIFSMPLNTVGGKTLRLADYKDKVLVVNFWATWCPPCRTEIPDFIKFQNEFADKGVQVIGIDFMERPDRERLQKFIDKYGINYPIVFGKPAEMQKVAVAMDGVFGLPVTKFFDRQGNLVNNHVGGITIKRLKAYVAPILGNN